MITRKYNFSIRTCYVGSEWQEEVELQFDDDSTKEEIEAEVDICYQEWLNENNYGCFYEIETP